MTGHAIQPSPGPDTASARRVLVFFLFALGCFLLPGPFVPARPVAADPPPLELTDRERRFIETHPEIRVVFDPEFPPFEFHFQNEFSGLSADLLRAALKGTGLTITPAPAQDWPALLEVLKERRADMAAKIVYTPERAQYLLFTQPYISIPVVIIVSAKNTAIRSLDDLAGRRVAMVPGYGGDRWFTENGPAGMTLVPATTVREALRHVAFGEVEAFVGNQGVVSYLIDKEGLPNLRLAGAIGQESALRMAVRDDWPELRSILDKVLDNLPNKNKQVIIQKWLPLRQDVAPPHWTIFVLIGLFAATLAISVLFHLYSRGLKRGIAEKTRELEAEFARRESAEKALRERDLHLRNVLLNSDAVVFEIAPDGTVAHIEGKALERIGLSPREMAGRPVSDFFGNNRMIMDGLAQTLSGKPVNYIAELEKQHASIMAAPVFGEHGEITGIYGVATDVTSLALAQKRLAESEERLALILDATNDGFVDWDLAANIAHLSPWLVDTYGLSSGTITDVIETWLSRVHPEDRQRALACLEAGLWHDDIIEDQYRLVTPSGAVRWILDRGRVVARDETGKALRFVGTATDITDRKESELRYQALFQAATDAIMILENGRITDCNPATSTLLGYAREELLGRTPQDLSPVRQPDGRPSSELAARKLSQAAKGNLVFEWVHRRNDGEPVEVEVSLAPLPSINSNVALALVRDVTQRKKM
ncbi:MAG: transporter substrate-binding domain-containing protein, partial [Desulfovibrio sp.]|nr:transporter substrate-binding domain-containing protein [Desulfovibrio sp.]